MGEFANTVQEYLCEAIGGQYVSERWDTEYTVSGTPVDVGGKVGDTLYLIELEWRRADPADNAAKIFRHVSTEEIQAKDIKMIQVFTKFYDLSRGGVSSKRQNAEFVGEVAAQSFDHLSYATVEFKIDPPKQGEDWPETWQTDADETVSEIQSHIESADSD